MMDAPDATITAAIARAPLYMRSDIPQEFIHEGALLLAAHTLTIDGVADADSAGFAAARRSGVKAVADGPTRVEFHADDASGNSSHFQTTSYGREFKELMDRFSPRGIVV